MARIVIPFASGAREDVDPKVMPEGGLKRAENLRMRRDGRLGVRYGYTALSLVGQDGTIVPYDLTSFNGRLMAFASPSGYSAPNDIHEYVNQPQFAWRGTDSNSDIRLCPVTSVREVGRVPSQGTSTTVCDVAAAGGIVLMAWQASATSTAHHIFNPVTDATLSCGITTGYTKPRVLAVGTTLFALGVVGATVTLKKFNPATDNGFVNLTDAFGTGDTILALDACTNEAGTGFAVALARSTPTVTIKLFDSTGTATQTITGPAVTLERMAVFQQAARVHLAACEADDELDLYTYTISSGLIENTTLDIGDVGGGELANRQPGICVADNTTDLLITYGQFTAPADNLTYFLRVTPSTHAVGTSRRWDQAAVTTKPIAVPDSEMVGAVIIDASTGGVNAVGLIGIAGTSPVEMMAVAMDQGLAPLVDFNHMPALAKDASTGKFYWAKLTLNLSSGTVTPVVAELVFGTGRRQTAVIDNQLYIASGTVQMFDARQLVEAGFQERPRIVSATPSNGAGSLTPNALYLVCATFEWTDSQGRFHTSEPSDVTEVTMGASDDTISVTVTTPHSLRCNINNEFFGSAVSVVTWRSLPAPDKQLLRDITITVSPTASGWGREVTGSLVQSDSALEDEAVIYTQGASGARSGPNPFVSPLPCRYIWPSADKLVTGGLPAVTQIQESRAAFPNEPITWAQNLGGLASAPESVLAVARLDERRLAFTASGIFEFTGDGLDINGVGDLGNPRRLPSPGGLYGGVDGWRSLVETHVGIYFQLAADSIFLLPRGGGAPVFVGKPVRDTLASFPTITSATYLKTEQLVCFTCNNLAGNDSVILVHDLDHGQWFVDTDTTALTSSCEYGGRLVILRSTGAIEWQNATHPAAAFISTLVESGTLYPFGQGGQGQIDEIQFYGEFRGNCVLTPSLSFDDGKTYTALTAKSLSTAGSPAYVVGDTVSLKWGPQRMRGDRVRLKFECTALSGAATEGLVYNYATIDFTAAGRSALRDTNQKG
jgi:hypothetical protein